MRVIVTGAAGFVGRRLAETLLARGQLAGEPITELVLADRSFTAAPPASRAGLRVLERRGDLRDEGFRDALLQAPAQALFHLAATLTAEAERDFEAGLAVNLLGFAALLEACRRQRGMRLVFSSSMAAFGGALPAVVPDEFPQRPSTSYGTHKAVAELLLDDYARRGFLDGRALRLPVVLLRRHGSPPSLSERISAVVREPLAGRRVVSPFTPELRLPVASVGAVARALIGLYEMPEAALGAVRTINLPALSVTLAEMVAALERRAGAAAAALIEWRPDRALQAPLEAMPQGLASARAAASGLAAERQFDDVIADFLANEPQPSAIERPYAHLAQP